MMETDIVVVGAGAAGIGAARALAEAGHSVLVLEARQRIGGRAFTDQLAGQAFDAGGAYIHFADRNPWTGIARALGVATAVHAGWDRGLNYRGGRPLPESEARERRRGFADLFGLIHDLDPAGPDRSLADLAEGRPPAFQDAARRYARQAIGEDPARVSALDIAASWEGPDLVVEEGYGTLVARHAQGLDVRTGHPVTRIAWGGPGVSVETAAGAVRARHAVVTVPVGVLSAGGIHFDPGLPGETQGALAEMSMGALTKIVLAFDGEQFGIKPWTYLGDVEAGFVHGCWHFGRDLVIVTVGGDRARDLIAAGEDAAVAEALDSFAAIAGGSARKHWRAGRLSAWWGAPFSEGAYSVVRPGGLWARQALHAPIGGRVLLAGEAFAGGGCMTVGGAYLDGRRAAAAILAGAG